MRGVVFRIAKRAEQTCSGVTEDDDARPVPEPFSREFLVNLAKDLAPAPFVGRLAGRTRMLGLEPQRARLVAREAATWGDD